MVTTVVDLKIWEKNCVTLYAQQGEVDSRYIKVSFKTQDSSVLSLTDKSVTIYCKKPDNTKIFENCTIDTVNNTATVKLKSQFLSSVGIAECEFQIFDSNSVLLKITGLRIVVFPSGDFSEAIESTSEYNALVTAINRAQGFSDTVGDVTNLTTTNKVTVVAAINEVNQKTMPISQGGTNGTSATQARQNLEVLKAYTLYDNDSGNEGTVTLSDNFDNYEFVDIILWDFYVTRVYSRHGRPVGIMKIGGYGYGYFEWYSEAIGISDNVLTRIGSTYGKIESSNSFYMNHTTSLPIRSVIGYKY